jgi:uncharacterized membrane protein
MESRFKLLGHAVHPMLIVFPLGLLGMAAVFDIIQLVTETGRWSEIAFWMIGAGVVTGLLAAVPGFADWLSIPTGTRAKAIGLWQGAGNVLVVLLFAGSWVMRRPNPVDPAGTAYVLSFAGFTLALVTGWLGGELVERLGIGVDHGANPDAPNSISSKRADARARTDQRRIA